MDIIPVIDIRNGVAVRAVAGRRNDYLPLASPLARSSAPLKAAADALLLDNSQLDVAQSLQVVLGHWERKLNS